MRIKVIDASDDFSDYEPDELITAKLTAPVDSGVDLDDAERRLRDRLTEEQRERRDQWLEGEAARAKKALGVAASNLMAPIISDAFKAEMPKANFPQVRLNAVEDAKKLVERAQPPQIEPIDLSQMESRQEAFSRALTEDREAREAAEKGREQKRIERADELERERRKLDARRHCLHTWIMVLTLIVAIVTLIVTVAG